MNRGASGSLAGALGLLVALALLTGCGRTPQLGGSEEGMRAADALWTAVTSRRPPLVEQTAAEIERLRKAGELPEDAYAALNEVVVSARSSQWDDARRELKKFLQGQRPPK